MSVAERRWTGALMGRKLAPIYYWVDHTAKFASNTGMQRVARSLARALSSEQGHVVFVRWDSERGSLILATRDELEHLARFHGPRLEGAALASYPGTGEVRKLHETEWLDPTGGWLLVPEVTHITFHETAPTLDAILYARHHRLRSAFIFYDAIPLKLPEYSSAAEDHARYMQQIALADVVVPISRFAAKDYVDYLRTFLAFDANTLPSVWPISLPAGIAERPARRPTTVAHETLILSVGTLEPRKNQIALINAFEQLLARQPGRELRLALVGHLHGAVEEFVREATRRNPQITYLDHVDDAELVALYDRSAFTVFPSVEEGFGLPILESLWHGKPCVCADFGAMDEVARAGGCLQVDVRSSDQLAVAMERLVTEPELQSRLVEEAWTRPIKTWDQYGKELMGVLEEVERPRRRATRIFYWVDRTVTFPANSGIQRVVRLLARSLIAAGVELVPVRWDSRAEAFVAPKRTELEALASWSGPTVDAWTSVEAVNEGSADWLLIPELTTYPGGPDLARVTARAAERGMRSAIIFYDALPYKMADIYAPLDAAEHAHYMSALEAFDRVLAISDASRLDLRNFLMRGAGRLAGLDDRLVAVPLSGEFPDTERPRDHRERENGDIVRILSVGTIESRKNQLRMIRAFLSVVARARRKAELLLVGSVSLADLAREVQEYVDRGAGVKWLGHVDDARLAALYRDCHFTVYPSLDEGFGLPIVESLWHGKPCVCGNRGAIAEVAEAGGCLLVDTADEAQLAEAIARLIDDAAERARLGAEAAARRFKTWRSYGEEVLDVLAAVPSLPRLRPAAPPVRLRTPVLSVCITTYNRAEWLDVSLRQLAGVVACYGEDVELLVCDNASSDGTEAVTAAHRALRGFRYVRNPVNVGMLGNLRKTVQAARGRFVWILGDDDIVRPGALERILGTVLEAPSLPLIYLNYAYTRQASPRQIGDLYSFLASALPIVAPGPDRRARIAELAPLSENFFTGIYCLVFRRDHALRAYSQNVAGPPFSSLLTAVPTAHYVCHELFDEVGHWIGEPAVVVNMNVSWERYAPLWVLERLPELYELAEIRGANPAEMDRWRVRNLGVAVDYVTPMYFDDRAGNRDHFSFERFIRRHRHLQEFRDRLPEFAAVYRRAYEQGRVLGEPRLEELLRRFGLPTG